LLLAMLPIGDTLFLTPTLRALRARYPSERVTAVAYAANAPLLRSMPSVDEVVQLPAYSDPRSAVDFARLVEDLRRQGYDAAIDFTSPAYKWISIGAGIGRRTYMKFDPGWWWLPGRHEHWRATHATRLYYDCAAELDLPPWDEVDHRPWLQVPGSARDEATAFLAREGVEQSQTPIVALHPGGTGLNGQKRWDRAHFASVADALCASWKARVLLLGGPDERSLASDMASDMSHSPVLAAGRLSLLGTIALLARCDLFIGNDSSLLHLAACQGTPYVGIFGPTCLANFQPIPARPRQGRLAVAWPPAPRIGYFVGARSIWQRPTLPRDARAALRSVTPDLVLGYANELLGQRKRVDGRDVTVAASTTLPRGMPSG
jgi:lipopolysaccharide heptosyltransferase II